LVYSRRKPKGRRKMEGSMLNKMKQCILPDSRYDNKLFKDTWFKKEENKRPPVGGCFSKKIHWPLNLPENKPYENV
jgi:hypothetical protein